MAFRHRSATCIGVCVLLAAPAAAQAKTKTVDMGTPAKAAKKFQDVGADVNDFFLHSVTIRAGDSVKFRPLGFHTADLPPRGGGGVPLIVPNGQKVANSLDAANAAFWFNGQDQVGFNPELLASGFGKRFTYNGSKRVNTGLPLAAAPKPMTVKFPKKGKYTYVCDIHPGMEGQVVVKGKRARIPTAKQDKRRLKNQIATALKRAKKLPSTTPPANTVYTGGSAKGGVEYFGMLPGNAHGQGRHERDVRDVAALVRGAYRDLRPRRPRSRSEFLPRPDRRDVRGGAGDRPEGRVPERAARHDGDAHERSARQRVLELRRPRPGLGVAADPRVQRRQVRGRRDVRLLLRHPPVHAREGRRHAVRRAIVATLVTGAAASLAAPASGAVQHYWVGAAPVTWNMVPNGRDAIMGMMFDPSVTVFPTVVYRRYTRNWRKPLRNTPDQDLVPGPLLRARVGDKLRVHFKNFDTLHHQPHSMHFHGVHYRPSSDGAYLPGVSGGDAEVKPGRTWTYKLTAGRDSAGAWPYHDHSPSMEESIHGGMYGMLSIRGRHEPLPDREFVVVFAPMEQFQTDRRPRLRRQHAGVQVAGG